jgi:hypothetical protein
VPFAAHSFASKPATTAGQSRNCARARDLSTTMIHTDVLSQGARRLGPSSGPSASPLSCEARGRSRAIEFPVSGRRSWQIPDK